MKTLRTLSMAAIAGVVLVAGVGCSGAGRAAPVVGFGGFHIGTEFTRQDVVVLGSVEGTSTLDSYVGGIVQVVDGDKVRVLGIPFFTEKYAYVAPPSPLDIFAYVGYIFSGGATPESRANYKALEKQADADAVFSRSVNSETSGVPFFATKTSTTVYGKAIQVKTDR